ncbi:Dimethylaniline monooxygenase [N-oxide-forming] 5 [Holothuria leucospilota]|uniref:Flavin-containing monooxygenase n=1 Tax=Holothuria leucospilota TaxID=206669 RepID=A0A9Q1C5U2_HOLLE|nr:Dimethylaniline monooxygenase [N-oxide-forming] 5 [Holothuria leucospilota]
MVRAAILGAGASGLTAIKCCLDEGLEPVCFEKTSDIGGLWRYRGENDKFPEVGSVFKSTVINTSKETMCYSDFPCPQQFSNYMHNKQIYQYFRMYAEKFELLKHIQFDTSVVSVRKTSDFEISGRWDIELKDEKTQKTRWETFDALFVCNGHHATPNIPDFPGMKEFQGTKVHTHYYKTPEPFKDKKVVIIGIGNSGGDAAAELSRWASQVVYLSTRRGTWVMHRLSKNGIPADILKGTRVASLFPLWLKNYLFKLKLNSIVDHRLYGLLPKHEPLAAHPTVNDDLPNRILNGTVIVKPNIKRFTKTGVAFEDGTFEDNVDAVILATGYVYGYPFIPESVIKVEKNQVSLYKYVFPPDLEKPTLAVIGLIQPWGAIMPISELQCRWAARVFAGLTELPCKEKMYQDITDKKEAMVKRYVPSQRHTIQVDPVAYMDDVAIEFGVKPNFSKMLLSDPLFFFKNVFGPFLPYQYRIEGPGKWKGAKNAIETVWERIETPFWTRKVKVQPSYMKVVVVIVVGICVITYVYLSCSRL